MALNFEKTIDLSASGKVNVPYRVDNANVINEANNNEIVEFYVGADDVPADRADLLLNSDYDALMLSDTSNRLTTRKVSNIGICSFPGIGSYGFFKYAYSGESKILVPINATVAKMPSPSLTASLNGSFIDVVVTAPQDISYECYKVVMLNGLFSYEYTIYEETYTLPKPLVKGTYDIFCVGYVNEGERTSLTSNIIQIEITTGLDNFTPNDACIDNALSLKSTTAYTVGTDITMVEFDAVQQGNLLVITGICKSSVDIGDTAKKLFTVNLSSFGISSMIYTRAISIFSDAGNSVLMAGMQSDGEVWTYDANTTATADNNINFSIVGIIDSFS